MKRSSLLLAVLSAVIDLVAIIVGLAIAYQWRSGGMDLYYWSFSRYTMLSLWTLPVWFVLFAYHGQYNVRNLPSGWNAIGRALVSMLSGWGAIMVALYLWRAPEAQVLSRLLLIYAIILSTSLIVVDKVIFSLVVRILKHFRIGLLRTVIINGNKEDRFIERLKKDSRHGRSVVAVISADNCIEQLEELNRTHNIEEVIVEKTHLDEGLMFSLLNWAEVNGKSIGVIPSALSVRSTNVEISTLVTTPVMFFLRTPLEGWGRAVKRLLDLVIVIPSLIIISPALLIEAILVKISSPGPVMFKQKRVGQDGSEFYLHKFRSMYADADQRFKEYGAWSTDESKDPRITPIGHILRKSMLDELPQLWDVFIGKMSLVGPRPEQPKHVDRFVKEVPGYFKRHYVKTGLTGWAQINGARGDTPVPERVKYDLYYIENWSIWFDLRIIMATVGYVLRGGK